MGVQLIVPETWGSFVDRVRMLGSSPIRWSWMAILHESQWRPYAVTLRRPYEDEADSEVKTDQVWISSRLIARQMAQVYLLRRIVNESADIQPLEPQESYSAYWLDPGTEYGVGTATGWPEYYGTWPLGPASDLRYRVQWHNPIRSGRFQFRSLVEAAFTLLFGQRFVGGPGEDVQPGIAVRIAYPYRIAGVKVHQDRLEARIDWSGDGSADGLTLHANWRSRPQQAHPSTADLKVGSSGGLVDFATTAPAIEVELFLNDPRIPVPCHEWRWWST